MTPCTSPDNGWIFAEHAVAYRTYWLAEFNFPAIDIYIEQQLHKAGLLPVLEDSGILPTVQNPNPIDREQNEEAFYQWWEEDRAQSEN